MFASIRRYGRAIAFFLLFTIVSGLFPIPSYALTGGPSQPETQQFAPAGMDNMVDPFTGDFSYNIPLLDVGGYPVNINYAAGITPDQEASWVGLGWNLNVGAINRSVRGLPDDFSGDQVVKEYDVKPNQTYGVTGNINMEIFGAQLKNTGFGAKLGVSANLFYNNYNGFGLSLGASPGVNAGMGSKSGLTGSLGLNATLSSESGVEVTPTLGLSRKEGDDYNNNTLSAQIGFPYSTREGLKGMSMSASYSYTTSDFSKSKGGENDYIKSGGGSSIGAFQGFAAPTYSPAFEHHKYNINASLNLSFSPTNPATENPAFGLGGYYSGQFLNETRQNAPAYGYMYSGASAAYDKLMDFNREKDGGYNKFTTNLAVTNYTYDIFQVSGQGVGGTYRPYRGDIGTVHDPASSDRGYSPGLGLGFGIGTPPSAKVEIDGQYNQTNSFSGRWQEGRGALNDFNSEYQVNDPGAEKVYFKKIGDMSAETDKAYLYDVQMGFTPFRHAIASSGRRDDGYLSGQYDVRTNNSFESEQFESRPFSKNTNSRTERRLRSTAFTTLTASEAAVTSIEPIKKYGINTFAWYGKDSKVRSMFSHNEKRGYAYQTEDRVAGNKKGHHLSEIRVTDESGSRYVYGIPVYNNTQEEVTFAKPGTSSDRENGYIIYTPGSDDGTGNKNGKDHYYNKVETPAFAYSYLLTSVLSPDYVDRDMIKGPSDGDLGSYTKFNYAKVHDSYEWRTPLVDNAAIPAGKGAASFNEGMRSDGEDDKASYVYGTKEIWYLHSIETRTHVAEFHLKPRQDALGASGRNGRSGDKALYCLDKIVLYSKTDKDNSSGEPVKTVHFDYDYLLCPNTPNSKAPAPAGYEGHPGKGKLTLRQIWFTYGKSGKGVLNPYKFNYCDQSFGDGPSLYTYDQALNPAYDSRAYDRWGGYKPYESTRPNFEWPYAEQNQTPADRYAAVYALSTIQTPTGGAMAILYEADDYGYVQNRRAARMYQVEKALLLPGDDDGASSGADNMFDPLSNNYKYYLKVDLGEGFSPDAGEVGIHEQFQNKYLSDMGFMYYKMYQEVIGLLASEREEFVPGYAEFEKELCRVDLNSLNSEGRYTKAYIKLKPVAPVSGRRPPGLSEMNPIVRNGWMFARMYFNRELSGSANAEDSGLEQVVRAMIAQISALAEMTAGFSAKMIADGNGHKFVPSKSLVRLNDPDRKKIGGGHRVKALIMSDNWGGMRSAKEQSAGGPERIRETAFYGQTYDYTMKDGAATISAGVAAWEPMLGAEENPFRLPVFVREKVPLAPGREYYLEEPFGESFFPAPIVGYRKVVVKPLRITAADLADRNFEGNGTGRVEHEFYTAYDFPTFTNRTAINPKQHQPNILSKFMKFDSRDLVTCTQGYYIELNDMHGRQKTQRVYPESGRDALGKLTESQAISEVEYTYQVGANGRISNQVPYITRDLKYMPATQGVEFGLDVDVVQDERYSISTTIGGGAQFNLKHMQFGVIPVPVPTGFPDINNEETRFRSVVTTKVVNRHAILVSTRASDNGSTITTRNLAWDVETGQGLLTEVQNEFHDPVYSFTYPGHWAYPVMGPASGNEGLRFTDRNHAKVAGVLRNGDELLYENTDGTKGLAYYDADAGRFLAKRGSDPGTLKTARIIRSGARNTLGIPVGTVVTLANPVNGAGNPLHFSKVLNAGASVFRYEWEKFCNCEGMEAVGTNPFVTGRKGNPRPYKSYTYLTGRTQSRYNQQMDIRQDGYFTDYIPFWSAGADTLSALRGTALNVSKWQYVTEITHYNPVGMEIENKDALERYSMAQFGYGRNLPVATSNNSRYRETGFDGFEDYSYEDCEDDHLSWRAHKTHLTQDEAHTGRRSIKVGKGNVLEIRKVIEKCE